MRIMLALALLATAVMAAAASRALPDQDSSTVPPPFVYDERSPGESERLPRPWVDAPPIVPHSLEGLLPITRDENACTMCHLTEGDADAPPVLPPSHVVRPPDGGEPALAGNRWVCTGCHVPRSNAPAFPPK